MILFCRPKTTVFVFLGITISALYLTYRIYSLIKIHLELAPICRSLNEKFKGCNEAFVNPKRAIFQELLRKWIDLVEKNNISYVLSYGSLLGQYRNQDIIPWDYDVDILVKDSSFTVLQRMTTPRNFIEGGDSLFHFVVQPEYTKPSSEIRRWNCNGKVVEGQPDHCSFIGPIARLIKGLDFLDIFGVRIKQGWAYESYEKKYFKVSDLFPATECLFMDILTQCPQNSKNVLETFFHSLRQPCYCDQGKWKVLWRGL